MREGTTKLLAACKHRTQSLEAAKNLLTSNERMSAYMSELQKRKKEAPSRSLGQQPTNISKARLSLSDLRMPLIWRDTDHFKNKGDYRRFAVFCLARVGTEIYDTSLLSPVDRSLTDLTFPDIMLFNNVPPDFELKLEVYSHILQDDLTMASTSRKIKKTIHSSISRTVGKKLAATLNDELNAGKIGPRFELTATARLTLDEVHDNIRTHDLQIQVTDTRSHQLPLFGHFCCRLAAQPNSFAQQVYSGVITICLHDDENDDVIPYDQTVFARLQSFKLEIWEQRRFYETGEAPPIRVVPINKLRNVEEKQKWLKNLKQQSDDHRRWRYAAENCLDVLSPESIRNSFMKGFRQGSLYDQTPIIGA
ncbi:rhotekin, putative [Pediculus humanus corporis]|uniref:Rhotekin, putative n=1 Tax=Pediculus humanus subsp. corporis TaxID=121224 RepID=E0VYA8_PEDHC|nr:rhotekin, putative [Pediculus humanus corporis]EEB18364.1 rhotekin, putative [Pediculus humanus corporis]